MVLRSLGAMDETLTWSSFHHTIVCIPLGHLTREANLRLTLDAERLSFPEISPYIIFHTSERCSPDLHIVAGQTLYLFGSSTQGECLYFGSHSISFTLWLKRVEKHFYPGATPWYSLVSNNVTEINLSLEYLT